MLGMQWHPVMMEYFGTDTRPTVAACMDRVTSSDLLLLIVAFRQGWVPKPDAGGNGVDSITALELAAARQRGIEVIALLGSEDWPGSLWEKAPEARAWMEKFRSELNLMAVFFEREGPGSKLELFKAKVRQALVTHQQRLLTRAGG